MIEIIRIIITVVDNVGPRTFMQRLAYFYLSKLRLIFLYAA